MQRWALWSQPWPLIGYVLAVEVAALASTAALAFSTHVTGNDWLMFAALAAAGMVQATIGRRVERVRRRLTDTPYINLTSVWTFAGVLVLPAALVGLLTAVLYVQLYLQPEARRRAVPSWRAVMNAAFVILTCYAARSMIALFGLDGSRDLSVRPTASFAALACAMAAYFFIALLLVVPSVWVRSRSLAAVLGTPADNVLELTTLCLGAVAATAVADMPAMAFAVVLPLSGLHRGLLTQGAAHAAVRDHKTGALSAATWQWSATQTLAGCVNGAATSVLMIDLDWFKAINDAHGHLVGDHVLRAVAMCVQAQVRDRDEVGRFGGEEFAVLLPDTPLPVAVGIAERIRSAVAHLEVSSDRPSASAVTGLSVSIGVADYPRHGADLASLLHAADAALYDAKRAGRNRVAYAGQAPYDALPRPNLSKY